MEKYCYTNLKKTEPKDQLESYEGYINDIPLVIDPCNNHLGTCKIKLRESRL